jgi:metal-responsive CopG/Arc/MetJ family transcriptional regulator
MMTKTMVSFHIDQPTLDRLDALAQRMRWSRSETLRRAAEIYVCEQEKTLERMSGPFGRVLSSLALAAGRHGLTEEQVRQVEATLREIQQRHEAESVADSRQYKLAGEA